MIKRSGSVSPPSSVKTRFPQSNLAACMLPWDENFQLDRPKFEEHIQAVLDDGYSCLYLMGTAGEGYAVSEERFREVVEVFAVKTVRDGIEPQIGVIGLSMEQIIVRIRYAYELGIRMFQISLPGWGALDQDETMLFFKTVCGRFPDSHFLHYNLPRAKRIIGGVEYSRIATEVPNLVATKNSSTDYARTADLLLNAPQLQHFLLEGNFAMGCTLGECSLLCSYDTLFPKMTWRFFQAGKANDLGELFYFTRFFHEVAARLFAHCRREMIDGSYDKTFVWLRDPNFSNRLLPPYLGLSQEESLKCRRIFDAYYRDLET